MVYKTWIFREYSYLLNEEDELRDAVEKGVTNVEGSDDKHDEEKQQKVGKIANCSKSLKRAENFGVLWLKSRKAFFRETKGALLTLFDSHMFMSF